MCIIMHKTYKAIAKLTSSFFSSKFNNEFRLEPIFHVKISKSKTSCSMFTGGGVVGGVLQMLLGDPACGLPISVNSHELF